MDSVNLGDVVILASDTSDQHLMQSLLDKAGYKTGIMDKEHVLFGHDDYPAAMVVCHRASYKSPVPFIPEVPGSQRIVVFSDCTNEEVVVSALESGAHHYFDIAESPIILQARLEAALRQHSIRVQQFLEVEPFRFNLEKRSVYLHGEPISLSPKEFELAYYLFTNRHRVVNNAELMTSVWSLPSSMDARRIDTAACRIRKKMQLNCHITGWYLHRLRSVGYELRRINC